jgi:hypothetical protein
MAKETEDRFLVKASATQTEARRINRGHVCAADRSRMSGPMGLIFNLLLSSADLGSRLDQDKTAKITQNGANFFQKSRIFVDQLLMNIAVNNWHINFIKGV